MRRSARGNYRNSVAGLIPTAFGVDRSATTPLTSSSSSSLEDTVGVGRPLRQAVPLQLLCERGEPEASSADLGLPKPSKPPLDLGDRSPRIRPANVGVSTAPETEGWA